MPEAAGWLEKKKPQDSRGDLPKLLLGSMWRKHLREGARHSGASSPPARRKGAPWNPAEFSDSLALPMSWETSWQLGTDRGGEKSGEIARGLQSLVRFPKAAVQRDTVGN